MSSDESQRVLTTAPDEVFPPTQRFLSTEEAFQAVMKRDFPEFTVDDYATEKAAAEGITRETLAAKLWSSAQAFPSRLDLTGDGKIGLDDAGLAAKQAAQSAKGAWDKVTDIDREDIAEAVGEAKNAVVETRKKITSFDYLGAISSTAKRIKGSVREVDADVFRRSGKTLTKLGKTASGVQGLQDRQEAVELKRIAEEYAEAAEALTEERRNQLYETIEEFGALRLESLNETLGWFLQLLRALNQQNRVKEYELLDALGIDTQALDSMASLDMSVSQSLRTTATTGVLGVAAVLGTPAIVTGTVATLATASTGTAISTLSGAAASNAVLAWLGGGSLAAGGGGMAAGAVVLTGITVGATAGVTILAAGILISTHYAMKLTEAKTYQKETALAVASLENAWVVMDGIAARVDELSMVTKELRGRLLPLLSEMEKLVPTFDAANVEHATLFNQCGLLVKTMVELAQVPLFGDDGELTNESVTISTSVRRVLNTEIQQ
ncbi:MAG: hypothetical protein GX862_05115 [Leucobacter sp.]|nr:hypothetical protein [Leucobacter sp.]